MDGSMRCFRVSPPTDRCAPALLGAFLGNDWPGIWLNLGTELIGAGLTFLLIDQLLRRRERQAAAEQAAATSKADLIARLGSNVRTFAVAAAEDLRRHGWLTDGALRGASLMTADLQGAPLAQAHLSHANLTDAHLALYIPCQSIALPQPLQQEQSVQTLRGASRSYPLYQGTWQHHHVPSSPALF
jgi:hypothetical protein